MEPVSSNTESVLFIDSPLDLSEREWLITKLQHEPGIRLAQFVYPDLRHLRIIYDPGAFSETTLLNAVTQHGVKAEMRMKETPKIERVLVAVDPDEQSMSTVDYVGRIAAVHADLHLCLYCRLPALPPELREHGGSEDAVREQELGARLSQKANQWIEHQREALHPVLERARSALIAADVPESAIEMEASWDASPGESLAEALLRVARASGCHTIALARTHGSLVRELVHRHAGDALVHSGTGFAIWVIE